MPGGLCVLMRALMWEHGHTAGHGPHTPKRQGLGGHVVVGLIFGLVLLLGFDEGQQDVLARRLLGDARDPLGPVVNPEWNFCHDGDAAVDAVEICKRENKSKLDVIKRNEILCRIRRRRQCDQI